MMKAVIKRRARAAPHGLQRPIHFEHLADGDDALRSVGALAVAVEAAEMVVVQPASMGRS